MVFSSYILFLRIFHLPFPFSSTSFCLWLSSFVFRSACICMEHSYDYVKPLLFWFVHFDYNFWQVKQLTTRPSSLSATISFSAPHWRFAHRKLGFLVYLWKKISVVLSDKWKQTVEVFLHLILVADKRLQRAKSVLKKGNPQVTSTEAVFVPWGSRICIYLPRKYSFREQFDVFHWMKMAWMSRHD